MFRVPLARRLRRLASVCASLLALPAAQTALSLPGDAASLVHNCQMKPVESGLVTRPGYLEWISAEKLKPYKDALPRIADEKTEAAMRSPETMWYDEHSMEFLYQDSQEVVVGGRANCVGRVVGEEATDSQISKLKLLFGEDYRFRFPFRKAAGTDDVSNSHVINFWKPPQGADGKPLPVKYWRTSQRGRWNWTFPVGTIFGEVLYQQAPNGNWVVFEIRTRTRYAQGWSVNLFRPFLNAGQLADAIEAARPGWRASAATAAAIAHLRNKTNLERSRMVSSAFSKVFPPVDGALDLIPDFEDPELVQQLLTSTPFRSAEGSIWKEGGGLETYAPGSLAEFGIVPKGYKMGLIPVNEVSCGRCHANTGHLLGDFEFDAILYGEVWGEDRIFTWHLFEPNPYIYGTWDDRDVQSRKLNQRLVQAQLVRNERPSSNDPLYKPLPKTGPAGIKEIAKRLGKEIPHAE